MDVSLQSVRNLTEEKADVIYRTVVSNSF